MTNKIQIPTTEFSKTESLLKFINLNFGNWNLFEFWLFVVWNLSPYSLLISNNLEND